MELPRISKVRAAESPRTLIVDWAGGADQSRVDMTGVIATVKAFAVLEDSKFFRDVEVIDHGVAIGWPDGLDYSAFNLRVLAEEQQPMDGPGFVRWQEAVKLSNQETADVLGVSLKTIKNYRRSQGVPTAVSLACRALLRQPLVLQAHYRPRKPGRPRKTVVEG